MQTTTQSNSGDDDRRDIGELYRLLDEIATHDPQLPADRDVSIEHISAYLSEFVKSCVCIGYKFDGNPFVIINGHTQEERDALFKSVEVFNRSVSMGRL